MMVVTKPDGALQERRQVILAIDPGFTNTGFAVLTKVNRQMVLLDYGVLNFKASLELPQKIGIFHKFLNEKIKQYSVTCIALETPFLGKNAQNFLKLGYLRGIMYLNADTHNLFLLEYTPRQVKISVTGFGGAEKEQVARVISRFFPHIQITKFDATDAIAVGLCGLWANPSLLNK